MHIKTIKVCVVLFLIYSLGVLQAQEATLTTGGDASGSGGSVSYSVGQVVYTTNTGTNGSVAQGVQQPFEISVITGIVQAKDIHLKCEAFPNPATTYINLSVENYNYEVLSYKLFDINGKLVESRKLSGKNTTINMKNLVSATYFLKITDRKKEIKTFKIIKK